MLGSRKGGRGAVVGCGDLLSTCRALTLRGNFVSRDTYKLWGVDKG